LPRDAAYAHRQARALELRIAGCSQAEIAAQVGVSQPAVSRMIKRALRDRQAQGVDSLRALEHARGEALHKQMWRYAEKGSTSAAMVLARLMDRRAKMLGLDPQGNGQGVGVQHDYFAQVLVATTEEAEDVFAQHRAAVMADQPSMHTVPVLETTAELGEVTSTQEAADAAERLVANVTPEPARLQMRVYIFARTYTPFGPVEATRAMDVNEVSEAARLNERNGNDGNE
jgi:transcriptional regulator with XRE-family HTH domain